MQQYEMKFRHSSQTCQAPSKEGA